MNQTCSRPKCPNIARLRGSGLCEKHYAASTLRGYVSSSPVLQHLTRLYAKGYTLQKVASLASIDRTTLQNLGKWTPAAGVQKRIALAILAIPVPDTYYPSERPVDSTGTRRRIQALMAAGWTQETIAEKLNRSPASVHEWMKTRTVRSKTAARVQKLFDQLQLIPGPSKRTADYARRAGWARPMEWDDIDDPTETPGVRKLSTVEWHAELSSELTDAEIAAELGIRPDSLQRALTRAS